MIDKSECCGAEIIVPPYREDIRWQPSDYCAKCTRTIGYALETPSWQVREASAVYRGFDGSLRFFWQQVTRKTQVAKLVAEGHRYLGQVDAVVDSITQRHRRDADLIDPYLHAQFMHEYASIVVNPEWTKYFRNR